MEIKETSSSAGIPPAEIVDSLIVRLKELDGQERRRIHLLIIIFSMFLAVYSGAITMQRPHMVAGFSLIVMGFFLAFGYMFMRMRRLSSVDYTLPPKAILRNAERLHRYMTPVDWLITLPLIALFTVGGYMVVDGIFSKYYTDSPWPGLIYLAVMVVAVAVGFRSSWVIWQKEKSQLMNEVQAQLKQMGE